MAFWLGGLSSWFTAIAPAIASFRGAFSARASNLAMARKCLVFASAAYAYLLWGFLCMLGEGLFR